MYLGTSKMDATAECIYKTGFKEEIPHNEVNTK